MTFGATYWTGPDTCWSHSSGTVEHFEMSEMLIVVLGILISSTFAGMSNITSSLTPLTTPYMDGWSRWSPFMVIMTSLPMNVANSEL